MPKVDFLVVGSGIAGASIASELAPHASVAIVEQEPVPGHHATGRSAAMYIPSYGLPWTRRLTVASRAFFLAPPNGFSAHPLLRRRGCLTLAGRRDGPNLRSRLADLTTLGVEGRIIDGRAARHIVPRLRARRASEALLEPDAADIDAHALLTGYLRQTVDLGGEMRLNSPVCGIQRLRQGWTVALADGNTIEARVVVNAAGAWADNVAIMAGVTPRGLQPRRRTAVLLTMPAGTNCSDWPILMDAGERFYCRSESGGLLVSPCDSRLVAPGDAAPDRLAVAMALARIETALEIEAPTVRRAWAGLRTFAPDRRPVFGYDPGPCGFFWFAGQGGSGLQTAPAAARLGAALALNRPLAADLMALGIGAETFAVKPRLQDDTP